MELFAGKELDKVIAQDVMGHSLVKQKNGIIVEGTGKITRSLVSYSRDIGAAWEVVDRFGITLIPIVDGQWFAMAGHGRGWSGPAEFMEFLQKAEFMNAGAAVAETAPLAICLAAVRASEKRRAQQGGVQIEAV